MIQYMKEQPNFDSAWMRKFYDYKVGKKIKNKYGDYEYYRWFLNKRKKRQYKFSTTSILFHLRDINFKNCLEIGCGPGTWTKLLLKKYPKAKFTCIDISKEMIKQFKKEIKDKRAKPIVKDFLAFNSGKKYDFIFSSRAIEYIPDKPKVIEKISNLLKDKRKGIIISSPPHPTLITIKKLFGKKVNPQHTQRISVKNLRALLKKNNFKNIKFYPILFTDLSFVPTSILFKFFYKKKWNFLGKMFAVTYLVKFEK